MVGDVRPRARGHLRDPGRHRQRYRHRLKARLAVDEGEKLVTASTDNVEAYTLYLKGRFAFNKFTEEGLRQSLELYAQALEQSPDYARAGPAS